MTRAIRVLVVDDDRDTADMTAAVLSLHGFDATPVYAPERAVELAGEFDAVVADVWMPIDGCEIARQIRTRANHSHLLVAVTGVSNAEGRCREAGFDHVLLKPADPSHLVYLLSRAVPARAAGIEQRPPVSDRLHARAPLPRAG